VDMMAVNLTSERENVEIRYTLDGSLPGISSPLFEDTLVITETTTIAARCFRDNNAVSMSSIATFTKVVPLPASMPEVVDHGLVATYYEGDWDSLPDFNSITPLKSIEVDNFTLEPRMNNDYYGFSFEGIIEIPEDGVYDFYTDSDDGSELYINDSLLVDNDGLHGLKEMGNDVPLSKGYHKIKVNYFEKSGGDVLKVYFKAPGKQKQPIPKSILYKTKKQEK
jgi:alpha-L-fucosidase